MGEQGGSAAGGPGTAAPLPRRVPQVPPPPFGVAVSPGGASLFQPPKRRVERLREPDAPAPRWAPHPPARPPAADPVADGAPSTGAADTEIRRRPAAGGLIAGWNRAGPDRDGIGGAFAGLARPPGAEEPPVDQPVPEPSRSPESRWDARLDRSDPAESAGRAQGAAMPPVAGDATRPPAGRWDALLHPSDPAESAARDQAAPMPPVAGDATHPPGSAVRDQAPPPVAGDPGRWDALLDRPGRDRAVPPVAGEPARPPVGRWDAPLEPTDQGEPARPQEPWEQSAAMPPVAAEPEGRWDRVVAPVEPERWDRPAAGRDEGVRPAAEWGRVLPPVGDAPGTQDRTEDRGAAGVDEATTFMSQWGPPPLAVPRATDEDPGPASRGWGTPPAPSRTGAGSTGANPAPAGPRATAAWTRTPAADQPPPAPDRAGADPVAPDTGHRPDPDARGRTAPDRVTRGQDADHADRATAARQDADRLSGDRFGADRAAAGRQDADRADRTAAGRQDADRADRTTAGRQDADQLGGDPFGTDRADADRAGAGRQDADRADRAGAGRQDADRADRTTAGRQDADQPDRERAGDLEAYRESAAHRGGARFTDEPTEVIGPFDVGAWSVQGSARTAAPERRRPRGQDPRPERVDGRPEDRDDPGAGGGGDEPPGRGGGGGGGGGGAGRDPHRRTLGDRIRTFIRGIGQTFLTLGIVLLLLAGYEVWFTDLVNHRTQKKLTTALEKQWEDGDDPTVGAGTPAKPGASVRRIPLGDGFALIYVPDFGTDYVYTVVEGTGVDQLDEGPGHYVGTPLPGSVGNVAIAGHRVGKGSPFLNLDKLEAGSAIVIRTKSFWYTYRVLGDTKTGDAGKMSALGLPGREIVDPADVGVIAPVPDKPGATPTRKLLTLTTCHPKFSARERLVIHAIQEGAPFPVSKGTPPSMTG